MGDLLKGRERVKAKEKRKINDAMLFSFRHSGVGLESSIALTSLDSGLYAPEGIRRSGG